MYSTSGLTTGVHENAGSLSGFAINHVGPAFAVCSLLFGGGMVQVG